MYSIYESYAEYSSDDEFKSKNYLGYIRDGKHVHPNINARDAILRIRDQIRKARSQWKWVKFSEKIMGKGLHKAFKDVVK